MTPGICPVCRAAAPQPFTEISGRSYWRCGTCIATFLEPDQRPTSATAAEHYRTHENDPNDAGYRRFVGRLVAPLLARLGAERQVLDFGCGPGSAVAAMLEEAGHHVTGFDPLFAPESAALERTYDAIVLSEVAEHLHDPAGTFDQLAARLQPGGWLAVLTCFQTDDARFAAWHYQRDPTHVVFYRAATFAHLAAARGWDLTVPEKDVALMRIEGGGPALPG